MQTRVELNGNTYQVTSRDGYPAIRKLNRNGGTARWVPLRSATGLAVMRALELEPAMMPGFSEEPNT